MISRILCFSAFCAFVASPSFAGIITITVSADPSYTAVIPDAIVEPASLSPQHVGGNQWSIAVSDPSKFISTISVRTSADGYKGSNDSFDLPYSMIDAGTTELGAAITKVDASDTPLITFLSTASARGKIADLILFNLQARTLWDARRNLISTGEVRFQSIDAKLAYWVIQSSAQLVSRTFMQIDSSTESAKDWMDGALKNRSLDDFFGGEGVSRKDAGAAIGFLNSRTGTLYDSLILALKKDIQSSRHQKIDAACARANKLTDFFYDIPDERIGEFDGPHANVLVSSTLQAICLTRKIKGELSVGSAVSQDEREDAQAAIASVNTQIARVKAMSMWPDAQKEAAARAKELDDVVKSLQRG